MKLNHYLLSPVFLSVILLTGIMVLGSPTPPVFAADEKQNVDDKDKKPLKQITSSKIESLKGLNANEKRVIVFYKNDVNSEDLAELTKKGASVKSDFDKMRAVVVHIDAAKLKDLQLDPNIERVVEDQIVHASLDTSIPQISANSVYPLGITGQGIQTCIVDTGVDDTHPALNPLIAEINYVTLDINGDPTGDATDDHGHGTHVAGIVASNDAIFRGVAPDSSLMAAKVLDSDGFGFESDVASGIDWCVANGADVINLSLGGDPSLGTCDSDLGAMAVNDAVAAGVIVAVASGNDGYINAISSPACASGAIAVGAIDDFDGRTPFSNEGPQLDVVAPGDPVTSLRAPINGGGFATFSGTSMATPHVAGLAALILDANPALTQTQVRSAIENNALDLGDAGFDTLYGNGRIQASNSVNSVLPTLSVSDVTVTEGNSSITPATFTISLSNASASTVTVDIATSDGTATTADNDYLDGGIFVLTFAPGDTTESFIPPVNGDTNPESDETFNVTLSNPVNASILDDTGVGTILDDDGAPRNPPRALLSINAGGSGTILSVFGSGFISNSTITIQFDGGPLTTTASAIDGKFTTPITIPTATPGMHTISASDGTNTFSNQFIMIAPRVTPTETILFLNPINSGSPDSIVSLHGKGFAGNAGATITISVDGVQVTTTPVGKVGSFKNISITMPSTPGTHTISASDGANTAFSTFYVITPRLVLSSASGASGDMVTVSASGFIPNSTIHISFDGELLLDVTSTSSGRIPNTVINPTGISGLHTISISDDTSTVNSPYTIIP